MSSNSAHLRVTLAVACLLSLSACVPGQGAGFRSASPGGAPLGTIPGRGEAINGAAVYRLDIEMPAGRPEFTPVIALEYSTLAGSGQVGVGWYLAAASSISRCPSTMRSDGYNRGVHFDTEDRFCFNGQQLMLQSGKYGKSGSLYHTELDSNDDIELHGDAQQPDSYFAITYHDGKRDVLKQVVIPKGADVPYAWYATLREEYRGDTMEMHYDVSRPGEVLLTELTYNGRDNNGVLTPGTRSLRFSYEERPDVRVIAFSGIQATESRRLKEISVNVPEVAPGTGMHLLRDYQLSYQQSQATGRSLLSAVTECATDDVGVHQCLPPTKFSWSNDPVVFEKPVRYPLPQLDANLTPTQMVDAASSVQPPYMLTGDFDGDGRRELFYYRPGVGAHLYFLNADGSLRKDVDVGSFFQTRADARFHLYAADVDNDGAMDLPGNVDGHLAFVSWTGTDMGKPQLTAIPYNPEMSLVDVDGDGEVDVVQAEPVKPGSQDYAVYLYRNQDSRPGHIAFGPRQLLAPLSDPKRGSLGHDHVQAVEGFSGEALPTLLVSSDTRMDQVILLHQSADGTLHAEVTTPEALGLLNRPYRQQHVYYADINGDGLYDIVYSEAADSKPATWHYQLNLGGRFQAPVDTGVVDDRLPGIGESGMVVGDLDGGRQDEMIYPDALVTPFCMGQSHTVKGNYTTDDYVCSEQMRQADPWEDLGIYRYAVLKFTAQADGSLKPVVRHDSGIIAQANLASIGDIAGDGSPGVISPFSPWFANGHFKNSEGHFDSCPADLGCGLQVAKLSALHHDEGFDRLPDLMTLVVNGVGAKLRFDYYPLSSPHAGLYSVKAVGSAARYINTHQVYMDAPTPVVGSYAVSNGPNSLDTHVLRYGDDIYDPATRRLVGFRWTADDDQSTGRRHVYIFDRRFPLEDTALVDWKEPTGVTDDFDARKPGSDLAELTVQTWQCFGPTKADAGCIIQPGTAYVAHAVRQTHHYLDSKRNLWVDSDTTYAYNFEDDMLRNLTKSSDSQKVETVDTAFEYRGGTGNNWVRRTISMRDTKDSTSTVGADKATDSVTTKHTKDSMEYDAHNRMIRKTSESDKPTNDVITYAYQDDATSPWTGQIQSFTISTVNKTDSTVEQLNTAHMSYTSDGYYPTAMKVNDKDIETTEYDPLTGLITHKVKGGISTTSHYDAFGRVTNVVLTEGTKTVTINSHFEMCSNDCPADAIYKRVDDLNGVAQKVTWYNVRNEPMNDPYATSK